MQYTFSQACRRLAGRTHGFGGQDVKDAVNEAIQALAGLAGWECLRRVVRLSFAGPCFSLPQGAAGLVRACVNGRPTSVRAQDFRFVQSGPGDLARPPSGFRLLKPESVVDNGSRPVVVDPPTPFTLFAVADSENEPALVVRGIDSTGRDVATTVPALAPGTDPREAETSDTPVQTVTEVTVDDCARSYVTLWCAEAATDTRYPVGLYNPYVRVPRFRQYLIPEIRPGQPVDLLAEVRMEPLPLVRDTDVVPFDSLEPVEWMMRSLWCTQSGEVDQAGKYQKLAVSWLKSRETTDDTVQTSVVINNAFSNSLGEMSLDAWNI